MLIKVEEYLREDASSPYKTWFDSLPAQAAAKVTVAKLRMELGNTSNIKWFDGMGEYIIDWGPGYRIYLAKEGGHTHHFVWWWNQARAATRHRQGKGFIG